MLIVNIQRYYLTNKFYILFRLDFLIKIISSIYFCQILYEYLFLKTTLNQTYFFNFFLII